ncbi:MAG: ATP-binding protein [Planctomycetota bacterium]
MAFEDIPEQSEAVRRLRAALGSGRVPHAYLFVGTSGTDRTAAARELARALLCPEGADEPCGECRSCRAMAHGTHPDYEQIGLEELHEHEEDRQKPRQNLPIKAVRDLQDRAYARPVIGERRVFVVRDAETMSEAAANCFLRTLEEPPPGCFIVLIATGLRDLPETVLSRCWIIRFRNLRPARLTEHLRESGVGPDAAAWLARQAWGSPGVARRLHEAGVHELNRKLLRRTHEMSVEDNFELSDWLNGKAESSSSGSRQTRNRLQDLLDCLAAYYRDLALCSAADGEEELDLFNPRGEDALKERAAEQPPDAFLDRASIVLETIERIAANANRRLALDDMFTRLAPGRTGD